MLKKNLIPVPSSAHQIPVPLLSILFGSLYIPQNYIQSYLEIKLMFSEVTWENEEKERGVIYPALF